MFQLFNNDHESLGLFDTFDQLRDTVLENSGWYNQEYNYFKETWPDVPMKVNGYGNYLKLNNLIKLPLYFNELTSYVKLVAGRMSKATRGSAGWDVFSNEDCVVPAGRSQVVKCGVITRMSPDRCCLLLDKSGLSANKRITRRAGFIDSDYHKEWGVVLVNEGIGDFEIKVGDKIAQAHFMEVLPEHEFVTGEFNVDGGFIIKDQERTGGFGSTGR